MELISKPSKRIFWDVDELRRVVRGRRANFVKPMGLGEVAVVKTRDRANEWLEIREALSLGLGGEVLCRLTNCATRLARLCIHAQWDVFEAFWWPSR